MITIEKPDLDGVYLEHIGVKGMKWGVRKKRPDEEQRKKIFTRKRVAVGLALTAGALAAASLLTHRGRVKTSTFSSLSQRKPLGSLDGILRNKTPSPFEMRLQAGMAQHRNLMDRVGNQRLTDQTWRDAVKMNQMTRARFSAGKNGITDVGTIRKNLSDPNYVWNL